MDFSVSYQEHYVRVRIFGEVTTTEVIAVVDDLVADGRYLSYANTMWDMSEAKPKVSFRGEGVRAVVQHIRRSKPATVERPLRTAFLVSSAVGYGLCRMAMFFSNDDPHRELDVFMDFENASSWLTQEQAA